MRRARWWMLPLFAQLTLVAPAARANDDAGTRAAARAMAEDALAHYDKGDYAGALDLFDRADALVHAPTLGLMAARCLHKLGRLVEASERYVAVAAIELDKKAPAAQAKAQVTAQQERAALLPKLPSLVVEVEGAAPSDVRVTLDDRPLPAEILGRKRPTDPGAHRLEATRGAEVVTREITLAVGQSATITLKLTGATTKALATTEETAPGAGGRDATLRLAGFAAVGVGGAGLLVGAITGGVALSTRSSLDAAGCSGGHCPASQQSAVDRYNTLRMVSGPGLIVGGLLAAGGVTLVVVSGRASDAGKTSGAGWGPFVGPGSAGVAGVF